MEKMEIIGGVIQETWWSFSNSPPKGIFVIRHLTNFLKKNQEKENSALPFSLHSEEWKTSRAEEERERESQKVKNQWNDNKLKTNWKINTNKNKRKKQQKH